MACLPPAETKEFATMSEECRHPAVRYNAERGLWEPNDQCDCAGCQRLFHEEAQAWNAEIMRSRAPRTRAKWRLTRALRDQNKELKNLNDMLGDSGMEYQTHRVRLLREAVTRQSEHAEILGNMVKSLTDRLGALACHCGGACGLCRPQTKSLTNFDPLEARRKFDVTLAECARLGAELEATDACISFAEQLREQVKSIDSLAASLPGSYGHKSLGSAGQSEDADELDRSLAELIQRREEKVSELCGQCPDSRVCRVA
jgi:hypothetical protein